VIDRRLLIILASPYEQHHENRAPHSAVLSRTQREV